MHKSEERLCGLSALFPTLLWKSVAVAVANKISFFLPFLFFILIIFLLQLKSFPLVYAVLTREGGANQAEFLLTLKFSPRVSLKTVLLLFWLQLSGTSIFSFLFWRLETWGEEQYRSKSTLSTLDCTERVGFSRELSYLLWEVFHRAEP